MLRTNDTWLPVMPENGAIRPVKPMETELERAVCTLDYRDLTLQSLQTRLIEATGTG
jgi:hypothetical protein